MMGLNECGSCDDSGYLDAVSHEETEHEASTEPLSHHEQRDFHLALSQKTLNVLMEVLQGGRTFSASGEAKTT